MLKPVSSVSKLLTCGKPCYTVIIILLKITVIIIFSFNFKFKLFLIGEYFILQKKC